MIHLKHEGEFVLGIFDKGLVGASGRGVFFSLFGGCLDGFVVVEFGFEGIRDVGEH